MAIFSITVSKDRFHKGDIDTDVKTRWINSEHIAGIEPIEKNGVGANIRYSDPGYAATEHILCRESASAIAAATAES